MFSTKKKRFPQVFKLIHTFSNHSTTIINYFEERLTNASAESFNAKIKAFRSQLRGVADLKFLGQCKKLRGKFINCYLCLQIHSLWS
ncbi:transposase [Phocaeicola vulgatus]|uniref:transposase n=3 Tax=Phocaeicola vulgatus TaxID=821 RepID=UPI001F3CD5EE|nr:transposase [Phocaeicola vulgatus]MCG0353831.1 transposase [Phocaeicola vulgatus]